MAGRLGRGTKPNKRYRDAQPNLRISHGRCWNQARNLHWQTTWNDGIVECWPPARRARRAYASERILGMISGKRSIRQKMLNLHFMMMPVRHPFSAFTPENTPLLRKNQYNYIRFDSLNPPFQYPLRAVGQNPLSHHSIVPSFQLRSEAELSSPMLHVLCPLL